MKISKSFFSICILMTALTSPCFAAAPKSLAERVVTMNTNVSFDEEYNKALDEMQQLPEADKAKLSKELGGILVKDKSSERRANAASALGDLCSVVKSNAELLSKSFQDKVASVRQATVSGLKRCGATQPQVAATLKKMLQDKDESVKTMAKFALEELGIK
ncbi:MAG: HEAT repeat domain-containing protein [Bdellovibrio sp.]|nr:HEAT repeat domain-containing protein [Bdellovibrio sp.]